MNDQSVKSGAEEQYFSNIRSGTFALQVCDDCSLTVFPPKDACPNCESETLIWKAQSGGGTVYSCTTVHVTAKGAEPHNVSLVDLDCGVRMMSTVANLSAAEVRIGMRVRARVESDTNTPRVVFDAVEEGAR